MQTVLSLIKRDRLVVIGRGIRTEVLVQAALACAEAGVTLLESTFDHTAADPVRENAGRIAALVKALDGRIRIGAGTVLTSEEVRAAHDAGAEYIISPDTDDAVVAETKRLGMVSIPGAMTPTEVAHAWKIGADMVKLFPADDLGYPFIQNLRGPLGHIPLMATGGVNPVSIPEFLKLGVTAVGTGVSILRRDLIEKEDYEGIRVLAKMHVDAIRMA
ncbi:MAG: bifunctional 4-hydroxy-2-oxoglutarate aldolase/2-dehydro-3-deoxy-phosphogluconate aldolase [Kiritimatiellae bacterium]|nr:bifunctional 4-hydroxy-2-oxoglutarate aldolase/2-dehydro-3-deoxy-phosphogluconate aldolase [Kiritimatiellia bacterium]